MYKCVCESACRRRPIAVLYHSYKTRFRDKHCTAHTLFMSREHVSDRIWKCEVAPPCTVSPHIIYLCGKEQDENSGLTHYRYTEWSRMTPSLCRSYYILNYNISFCFLLYAVFWYDTILGFYCSTKAKEDRW